MTIRFLIGGPGHENKTHDWKSVDLLSRFSETIVFGRAEDFTEDQLREFAPPLPDGWERTLLAVKPLPKQEDWPTPASFAVIAAESRATPKR